MKQPPQIDLLSCTSRNTISTEDVETLDVMISRCVELMEKISRGLCHLTTQYERDNLVNNFEYFTLKKAYLQIHDRIRYFNSLEPNLLIRQSKLKPFDT